MLDKIKNLIHTEEKVRKISENISTQQQTMRSHTAALKKMEQQSVQTQSSLTQIESQGSQTLSAMQEALRQVNEIRRKLTEELADVKILKSTIKEKIVQEISSQIQSELSLQLGRLRTDVQSYNELKIQLQQLTKDIAQNVVEIHKFNEISRNIRAADFELTQHAKKIASTDREKLELMKKVDALERLLSRERRKPTF